MGVLMKNKVCYTGGNVKVQPVIYSTDEREIGVWTDGKPLYQKTIYCGATGGYETTVSVNHNISNIDKFIFIFGCFDDGEPVPTVNGGSDYIRLSADSTKIYIKYKDSWDTHTNLSVTVQYTKTTDTAGSGIWATNGAPAKHYSTTEQVIGTWIDGSTIYEKTIELENRQIVSGNNTFNLSITNMGAVIKADVVISNSSKTNYRVLNADDFGSSEKLFYKIDTTGQIIITADTLWSNPNIYVTLRYTKSTS